MILRIHIDIQKVERLGARLSWRSSLGRFGEISTAPQPRSRIPSLCKSAKRPTRRSSAPTGERARSASRASPDGNAQPTTIPDPGSCGLRPTGAAIRCRHTRWRCGLGSHRLTRRQSKIAVWALGRSGVADVEIHSACERACCTISTKTLRVSAGLKNV